MSMSIPSPSTSMRSMRSLSLIALLAVGACADTASEGDDDTSFAEQKSPTTLLDASAVPPKPDAGVDAGTPDGGKPGGTFFSEVTANGTGCPAGTWQTTLGPDGKTFRTTFSAFEAAVDDVNTVAVRDCTISITYHSTSNLALTVDAVTFGGWVYLEPGVEARVQSNFYFQGAPDKGGEHVIDMVGPAERAFTASNEKPARVKSRCGSEHTLNIRLTARLMNTEQPRGVGFLKVFDWPEPSSAAGVGIAWERCSAGK